MRNAAFLSFLLLGPAASVSAAPVSGAPVDWAQPAVGCIEELAPSDTPERDVKIAEIYDASELHGVPPQVLFGALMQEANFLNLGISADGGNYSCGIGQLNVREWCDWANTLSPSAKKAIEWPEAAISCDEATLPAEIVKPFYAIAKTRAPTLKGDQRGSEYYADIPAAKVSLEIAAVLAPIATDGTKPIDPIVITPDVVRARYISASSFTRFCGDVHFNIRAKAQALTNLFQAAVPAPLQRLDTYAPGEHFNRKCMRPNGKLYPLHTGWLTAVAMYNAGKKFLPRLASYYRMTKASIETDAAWAGFTPLKLIEGLDGGGRYNPETKELNYVDLDGLPIEASWYKACIVQQHVARVIGYVTRSGKTVAKSLEPTGCRQTTPVKRQMSSGFSDLPMELPRS